jgi:hypothetical protein
LRYRSFSVFSLGAWSPQFHPGLACPGLLRILTCRFRCAYGTLTPSGTASQRFRLRFHFILSVLQPRQTCLSVWADPRSLATTNGILSFPRATEMFQFTHLPPLRVSLRRGFPIRTSPAACGCTRLTGAFRGVPRPSSALNAKASTARPFLFPNSADTEKLMLVLLVALLRFWFVFCGC